MSKMKEYLLAKYEEEESEASGVRYAPERTINDLVKEIEEGKANE